MSLCSMGIPHFAAKPVITAIKSTEDVTETENLEVECDIQGTPVPVVTWLRDGVALNDSESNIRISTGSDGNARVSIESVSQADSGLYECVATNLAASVNMSIMINIQSSSKCVVVVLT